MSKEAEAFADWVSALNEVKNASLNSENPYFKSKYADFTAVREATLPSLKKHNLGISQPTAIIDGEFCLVSKVVHKSGVIVETSTYPLPKNSKPQEIGSAITYARRYSWGALCGISTDQDDDGNGAQETAEKEAQAAAEAEVSLQDKAKQMAGDLKALSEKGDLQSYEGLTKSEDFTATLAALKDRLPKYYERISELMNTTREAIQSRDDCPIAAE